MVFPSIRNTNPLHKQRTPSFFCPCRNIFVQHFHSTPLDRNDCREYYYERVYIDTKKVARDCGWFFLLTIHIKYVFISDETTLQQPTIERVIPRERRATRRKKRWRMLSIQCIHEPYNHRVHLPDKF